VFTPSKKTAKILTAASVKKLLAGRKKIEIPDGGSGGSGLRLVIQVSGHKSWAMRFRRPDGRSANLTLGPVDLTGAEMADEPIIGQPLTLAGARKLAASVARERALGRDPVADFNSAKRICKTEREERTANAFAPLARRFIEEHARAKTRTWALSARLLGLKPDTLETIPKGLADRWRVRPVTEITPDDIHDLIDEIRRRGVPGWARRNGGDSVAWVAHARIAKFFSWLMERRIIAANPCAAVRRPDASTPRDRVLTDDEIKWLWLACGQLGEPFGPLLKLLLLTGQRRSEVAEMTWTELTDDTWSLPASRTKNGRPHVVPLSRQARDLIASLHRVAGAGYVFTTNGSTPVSGWSKTKLRLDAKMLEVARAEDAKASIAPWTIHDLRRTCAAGLQRLGVPLPVTERVLNHVSGSFGGIVGVYQRHEYAEERRDALGKWAQYVEKIAAET
jgi:integrase